MSWRLQVLATVTLTGCILAAASLIQRASEEAAATLPVQLNVPAPIAGELDWLVFGGGSFPADSQVTIESDVIDAVAVLGGRGQVMFAGGASARCVQVLDPNLKPPRLAAELGTLFTPRPGRSAAYRRPKFPCRQSSASSVLREVRRQLALSAPADLLLYAAGHGELGKAARDNHIALWAGSRLTVSDLASEFDAATGGRVPRLVATTCFSGGFGELVFRAADHKRGAAPTLRCGLFAATWDLESTGCDPNPDRRRHHGYGAYFLPALRGLGRDGQALPRSRIDFDGDGRVSLLEAHTRVRIAARTADVPTTTSERWLRAVAPLSGAVSPVSMPEETAVIRALATRLGVDEPARDAEARYKESEKSVDIANKLVTAAHDVEDTARARISAELLARWPTLDDPWHPSHARTLRKDATSITAWIARSSAWSSWKRAMAATDKATARRQVLRQRRAAYERLHRAIQTKLLAGRLTAVGGEDWIYWRQLLRCERHVPLLKRRAPIDR